MTKDVRLSFLLHTLLLLVALTLPMTGGKGTKDGGEDERGNSSEEQYEVTIVSPPSEDDVVVEDEGLTELKKIAPHAGDKCEKFYGGIGVQDSAGGVVVAYPGYPAERAGIQAGDQIISDGPIRGEVGTPVTVVILRGLRRITFELIRDKICIA